MSIKSAKQKGSGFERDAVELLTNKIVGSRWRKMPTSGAMGTTLGEPLLTGDITGSVDGIRKKFKIECKVGYGGSKQLTLKKEWIDKIILEAKEILAIPLVIGKFSGARSGTQVFVVLDIDTFAYLINELSEARLSNETDGLGSSS
jgi:Holliday junction resolvase